jgi:hypothetical protein
MQDAEDFDNKRARGNRGFGDGRPSVPATAPRRPVIELDEEDAEEVCSPARDEAQLDSHPCSSYARPLPGGATLGIA